MHDDNLTAAFAAIDADELALRAVATAAHDRAEATSAALSDRSRVTEEADAIARRHAYESRSDQQKHDDEIAGQNALIAESNGASYFWVAVSADGTITREYEPHCTCAPNAPDPHGHTKKFPGDLPAKPYHFAAFPLGEGTVPLPTASDLLAQGHVFEIAGDDEPVWSHVSSKVQYLSAEPDLDFHAILYGVKHASGAVDVVSVDHNAEVARHGDLDAAVAHAAKDHRPTLFGG